MQCDHDKLLLFQSGELDEKDRGMVEEHLQNCADCQRWLEDLEQLEQDFSLLPQFSMDGDVLENIKEDQTRTSIFTLSWLRFPVPAWQAAFAVILCGFVFWSIPAERSELVATGQQVEKFPAMPGSNFSRINRKIRTTYEPTSSLGLHVRQASDRSEFKSRITSIRGGLDRVQKDLAQDRNKNTSKRKNRYRRFI